MCPLTPVGPHSYCHVISCTNRITPARLQAQVDLYDVLQEYFAGA